MLNQLGHHYVVRLIKSITSVTIGDYCGTPVCRLVEYNALLSDDFAAEFFRRHLLKPRKLTISRSAADVLPAISFIGLYKLFTKRWSNLITPEWGKETARIANLNATTLKKIRSFPAEYVHLLHSGTFNLDKLSLDGLLPEGTVTDLPRTETFDYRDQAVVPTYVHLLKAKKLRYSYGINEEFKLDEVSKSCPHVEEIDVRETSLGDDMEWVDVLKQFRRAFPNWRHLKFHTDIEVTDVGFDDYFKQAVEDWSDTFEEHLRQDTAPLRIDATITMSLEDEGHFRASDLPKFKLDVKKKYEPWGTETTFTFTRNEDFGEVRILSMEASVERTVRDGAVFSSSEEEKHEQEEEERDQDD